MINRGVARAAVHLITALTLCYQCMPVQACVLEGMLAGTECHHDALCHHDGEGGVAANHASEQDGHSHGPISVPCPDSACGCHAPKSALEFGGGRMAAAVAPATLMHFGLQLACEPMPLGATTAPSALALSPPADRTLPLLN